MNDKDSARRPILESAALAVSRLNIESRQCFSCGEEPTTGQGEHVIPKWLQRRFGLYDQTINLLNGTRYHYRRATVPCCKSCNTGHLSRIENAAKSIFLSGSPDLSKQERLSLGRWMAKILVGLLYMESSLRSDIRDHNSPPIFPPEFMDDWYQCQIVIQSARKLSNFECLHGDTPFTLYCYDIIDHEKTSFDLTTNVYGQSIALRAGKLGAIFVNDGGMQYEAGRDGPFSLNGASVTALQFSELSARVHYKSTLRHATHSYVTTETDEAMTVRQLQVLPNMPVIEDEKQIPLFQRWDEQTFHSVFRHYLGSTLFDRIALEVGSTLLVAEGGLLAYGNGSRLD